MGFDRDVAAMAFNNLLAESKSDSVAWDLGVVKALKDTKNAVVVLRANTYAVVGNAKHCFVVVFDSGETDLGGSIRTPILNCI